MAPHLLFSCRRRNVLIVDDVVSTGGSLVAVRQILRQAGAIEAGVMCIFTEGGEREEVISLGNLPVNDPKWAPAASA